MQKGTTITLWFPPTPTPNNSSPHVFCPEVLWVPHSRHVVSEVAGLKAPLQQLLLPWNQGDWLQGDCWAASGPAQYKVLCKTTEMMSSFQEPAKKANRDTVRWQHLLGPNMVHSLPWPHVPAVDQKAACSSRWVKYIKEGDDSPSDFQLSLLCEHAFHSSFPYKWISP